MAVHKEKVRKAEVPFTQVANKILNDPELSFKAKGLFAYLYSKPDSWNFSKDRIAEESMEGREAVMSGLQELEDKGFLRRQKLSNGRINFYLTFNKPKSEEPTVGNGHDGKSRRISNKELKVIKRISNNPSAGAEEGDFNLSQELEKLRNSDRKDLKVISWYLRSKRFPFSNKAQLNAEIKRNLRAAKSLEGYSGPELSETAVYCETEFGGDKWTLETIVKRIPEVIKKKR